MKKGKPLKEHIIEHVLSRAFLPEGVEDYQNHFNY